MFNDLRFAFRQLLKNPGFTVHPPQYTDAQTGSSFRGAAPENPDTLGITATEDGPWLCLRSPSASRANIGLNLNPICIDHEH